MELITEIISLSKIRDGLFISDSRAGTNLDLLMQFKISHVINATDIPLPYSFESLGIKYLTIDWPENPPEDETIINEDIISKIVSFIDDANIEGEGLLGYSVSGKNRICVVIILYLITKYNWPLKKCLEYVKKKKKDMDINNYFMNQLEIYENNLFSKKNLIKSTPNWNSHKIKDKDELVMSNTYINELKKDDNIKKEENKNKNNKYKIMRNVEWGDNKKYVKQMAQPGLIHYNIDNDLFLKKYIEDVTEHINKKPLRSCIKTYTNINPNININKLNTTNRRKKTKIYLAADTPSANNKPSFSEFKAKNSYLNENNDGKQSEIMITQINNIKKDNKENNNMNINEKRNIFEDISVTEKNEDMNFKILIGENIRNKKLNKINLVPHDKNTLVNNMEIINKNNDSDDDIKLSIIDINKKNENDKKENININPNLNKKSDYGFNIVNIESKNNGINKDLKPILDKLLKIDPNLETLNKYLQNQKKNTYINYSNTLPNYKTNTSKGKQKLININPNNTNNEKNKIKNNIINNNTINLIPINTNANNNKIKQKNKEEKKKDIKLINNNLNINLAKSNNSNVNTLNNKSNKVFNKKFNNFFMDAYGNYAQGFMNKKRNNNNNSARIQYEYNGNNGFSINGKKFLSKNTNYYLGNGKNNKKKENKKKENTIIPDINMNYNSNYNYNNNFNSNFKFHTSNSQKNKSQNKNQKNNSKNKIININKNSVNKNGINNNFNNYNNNQGLFITNMLTPTNHISLNRKDSKYIYILYNIILYL